MLQRRLRTERDQQVTRVIGLGSIRLDQVEAEAGKNAAGLLEPAAVLGKIGALIVRHMRHSP